MDEYDDWSNEISNIYIGFVKRFISWNMYDRKITNFMGDILPH